MRFLSCREVRIHAGSTLYGKVYVRSYGISRVADAITITTEYGTDNKIFKEQEIKTMMNNSMNNNGANNNGANYIKIK